MPFKFWGIVKGVFPLSCLCLMFKYPFDTNFYFILFIMSNAKDTIQNPYTPIADNWKNAYKNWKKDAAKQATIAGAEFDADLSLLDYQNEYNSPDAKAARLRAAGLNPDLVGLDGASDSSGLSGLTGSSGIDTGPNYMEKANFWLSNGQNIFDSALKLAEQFQTMRGRTIENDMKNVQYVKALQGLNDDATSRAYLGNLLSSDENGDSSNELSVFDFMSGISKRNRNKIRKMLPSYESFTKGLQGAGSYYDSMMSSSLSTARARERAGRKDSFDVQDLVKGYQKVAHFLEQVQDYSARANAAEDKYDTDYYENSSGANDASIDSDVHRLSRDSAKDKYDADKGDKELNKFFSELVTGLRNDNSWYSNILLTVLYGMKSGAFQNGVDLYNSARPSRKKR